MPIPPSSPAGTRSDSAPAVGATISVVSGQGAIIAPIALGLKPKPCWSRKGSDSISSIDAMKAHSAPEVESASTGKRSRSTGMIGCGCWSSWRTNITANRIPQTRIADAIGIDPPCTAVSIPKMQQPKVTMQ